MFNEDYTIKGKYADYMRLLIASSEGLTLGKSSRIFEYGYQVLSIAPLIGVAYGLRQEDDTTKSMDFTIRAQQVIKNKNELQKVYRMILLSDRSMKLSPDERVDFVFRPQIEDKEKAKKLFNSYMLGGIEWLYDNLVKNSGTEDEYLNNIISAIQKFTIEFAVYEDIDDEVKEIEGEYFSK